MGRLSVRVVIVSSRRRTLKHQMAAIQIPKNGKKGAMRKDWLTVYIIFLNVHLMTQTGASRDAGEVIWFTGGTAMRACWGVLSCWWMFSRCDWSGKSSRFHCWRGEESQREIIMHNDMYIYYIIRWHNNIRILLLTFIFQIEWVGLILMLGQFMERSDAGSPPEILGWECRKNA